MSKVVARACATDAIRLFEMENWNAMPEWMLQAYKAGKIILGPAGTHYLHVVVEEGAVKARYGDTITMTEDGYLHVLA